MKRMNLAAREVLLRAQQRGYDPESIKGCILEDRGDRWIVDVDHPDYPRDRGTPWVGTPEPPAPSGPGTELKKLLKAIGITASPGCSCNKRARIMDENGVQWCEENVGEIVGWLREEATKRKLPFVDLAGRALVNLAIRRAKRGNSK